MEHSKEECLQELKYLVENQPKSFERIINGTGFTHLKSGKIKYCKERDRRYLQEFIKKEAPLLDSPEYRLRTKLFWILNNITSWEDPRVCCEYCGKPFLGRNVVHALTGYPRFCSRKCQYESPVVREQTVKTCMEKYGTTNASKSEKIIQKISKIKSMNGSFNRSIPEERAYALLNSLFPDTIRQFYSEKYPFRCDFYVPSKELYIECNFNWMHGRNFYFQNKEECKSKLKEWEFKAKTSKQYKVAIETWTIRDVKKREVAEKNHLNYLVFWNLEELKNYVLENGLSKNKVDETLNLIVEKQTFSDKDSALKMYEKYGHEAFEKYKSLDFPYYQVGESIIDWEINSLRSFRNLSDNQYSPLIRKYHKSIWSCSENGRMSSIEYWEEFKKVSEEDWKKFYLTRLACARTKSHKNGILRPWVIREGIVNCKKCHCVSYLKPFLAKRLISTYLSDASEIFCPMNGFSGFMLGSALGCGKRYLGQDINPIQIEESKNISSFLLQNKYISENQISLRQKDLFEDSGEYDCLVCCPPYNLKEKWNFDENGNCLDKDLSCNDWIKEILSRYKCRKYLFVIDGEEVTEFEDKIVETISNSSHFGENHEKIVLV